MRNVAQKFNKILEKYSEILGPKIKQSMQLIASELVVDLFKNYKDIILNIVIKTDEITLEINDKTSEHILFFAKSNADKILENKFNNSIFNIKNYNAKICLVYLKMHNLLDSSILNEK